MNQNYDEIQYSIYDLMCIGIYMYINYSMKYLILKIKEHTL